VTLRPRALACLIGAALVLAACQPADQASQSATRQVPTSASGTTNGSSPSTTSPATSPSATSTTSTTSAPTSPSASPGATPGAGTAAAALALLAVKGRAAKTGYSRDRFGSAWKDTDHNGCDTRNDVLRRDLASFVLKAGTHGCLVLSGGLHDSYTGRTINFVRGASTSAAVQIDHVVALSDAWQKGAAGWSTTKREQFANDSLNLVAVDGPTNASKGDGDAATWLPPAKGFRCQYVARQVAVKRTYGLWVTAAERDAIARVLASCPGQKLPSRAAFRLGGGREVAAPATTTKAAPKPAPKPSTSSSSVVAGVHPGAFCSPRGAYGRTTAGTLMQCKPSDTDTRNRWRRA
jgi:hypothetical protein